MMKYYNRKFPISKLNMPCTYLINTTLYDLAAEIYDNLLALEW